MWTDVFLRGSLVCGSNTALGQTAGPNGADLQPDLSRTDLRPQKKQIIAGNLKLTDKEAEKFWPIYDRYDAELVKISVMKDALIKHYTENYGSMKDEDLDKSAKEWLAMDQAVTQLRIKYYPAVRAVLSANNTALFFQLDRRISSLIDLRMAADLPLIVP